MGDTVYADNASTPDRYWDYWDFILKQKGVVDVCSSTSLVCTWDDHEVGNNWSFGQPGIDAKVEMAFGAFSKAIPLRLGDYGYGIWRKLSWGKAVDVFVLDCRSERRDGNYVSAEQLDWLKNGLVESSARFKIVLNSR